MKYALRLRLAILGAALAACAAAPARAAVDFATEIKPILEAACLRCHHEARAEGELRLESRALATTTGASGPALVPGDADASPLYTHTVLPADDAQIMPPDGAPLDESQTARLRQWIAEGATWPEDAQLEVQPRIDFAALVQPILEAYCISCHSAAKAEGELDLSTRQAALKGGASGPSFEPFAPEESLLYALATVGEDDPTLMPPAKQGGPLPKESIEMLRLWIAQGAVWPEDATLKVRPKPASGQPSPDDLELVRKLHAQIVARQRETADEPMADYSSTVPLTGATYQMVALEGGVFTMGSPAD
jgi:hypothetical protein